jgi:hypothetical protein
MRKRAVGDPPETTPRGVKEVMGMGATIQITDDGLFRIMLRPCRASVLAHLFDPEVAFVWVVEHLPNRNVEWWNCTLPLSKSGKSSPLRVRLVGFDLLMPTSEFLTRLDEFDGLVAHQMRREVPDTLLSERLDQRNRTRVLVENGLASTFYLPHAGECASFDTVEREAMEKALENDTVRALAY